MPSPRATRAPPVGAARRPGARGAPPRRDPKPAPRIRRAVIADLPAIEALEVACFQDYRRASERSLRNSMTSRRQSFWVMDRRDGLGLAALLVLWHFPHRMRIYDIATHPEARGQGLGRLLMQHAQALARQAGCGWLTLEAEEADGRLVAWYEDQGFGTVERLDDFYHGGCHALRMVCKLE